MSAGQLWRGKLTERQAEVAELVAEGLESKVIAQELFMSTATVKFHLGNIMERLGVRNRMEVARWWWEHVETSALPPRGWEGSD